MPILPRTFPVKSVLVVTAVGFIACKFVASKLSKRKGDKYIVIETIAEWHSLEYEIIQTFKKSRVIGLDCEWVTIEDKRKSVSLLQLANDAGYCVLIRLSSIPAWIVPFSLINLLKNEKIIKVGVGIHEDANKLFNDYCLEVRSFVDLRYLAKDLKEVQGKSMSLKSLGAELLRLDINKSNSLQCSNWDAPKLSAEQIKYAADDAIVAAKIFMEIERKQSSWIPGYSTVFSRDIENYLDTPFKQTFINNSNSKNVSRLLQKPHKTRYSKPRLKPMYDNCQLVAPDGELLCSCDKGKAEWYVDKGLGEKIGDDPFTVRLNFEPSGRPTLDNVFYTMVKCNHCAVCGETENFYRKLVVPSEYRRYFPNLMKKNLSHDVLLLCVHCHKKSNILDHHMREKLAEMCDAPLGSKKNVKYKFNPEVVRVKSAATALFKSGDKIPELRQKELKQVLLNYFNISFVTDEVVSEACNLDVSSFNQAFIPHGLKVYQYFCENGGLMHFEKLWRQHFLDTMNPQFLPSMWSVEHNHKRLALQVVNREREVNFDESILGLHPDLLKEIEQTEN